MGKRIGVSKAKALVLPEAVGPRSVAELELHPPAVSLKTFGPPGDYNGSLRRRGEKWYFASRRGGWGSKVWLSEYTLDFELVHARELNLKGEFCDAAAEDPRLFVFNGGLYLAFTGLEQRNGAFVGNQCLAAVDEDLNVTRCWMPEFTGRQQWEKNWQFFEAGGRLYAVYHVDPHEVLEFDGGLNVAALVASSGQRVTWPGFEGMELCGGAPPVAVGFEFYHWFHAKQKVGDWWEYSAGLYTFSGKPPFEVVRLVRGPVIRPKRSSRPKDVCYPCGAVLEGDRWIVSFGVDDASNWVAEFDARQVEAALELLPSERFGTHFGVVVDRGPTFEKASTMCVIETSVGPIRTNDVVLNRSICGEVIDQDCYRLRRLCRAYDPQTMWDVGMGHGQVSLLAKSLWPTVQVTGFELSPEIAEAAKLNCPWASVMVGDVGFAMRSPDLVKQLGYPDLLCIDCEGGEVPFFWELEAQGLLRYLKVIVGEWHIWSGRRLLEAALERDFVTQFVNPEPGAGPWSYFFAVAKSLLNPHLAGPLSEWVEAVE